MQARTLRTAQIHQEHANRHGHWATRDGQLLRNGQRQMTRAQVHLKLVSLWTLDLPAGFSVLDSSRIRIRAHPRSRPSSLNLTTAAALPMTLRDILAMPVPVESIPKYLAVGKLDSFNCHTLQVSTISPPSPLSLRHCTSEPSSRSSPGFSAWVT